MIYNKFTKKLAIGTLAGILIFIIFLSSCLKKEDFDFDKLVFPDWEPNFSLPLVHSQMDLRKVLNETSFGDMLIEDANKFLTLVYKERIYSQKAEDAFYINNQFFVQNETFSVSGSFNIGDSSTSTYTENMVFVNASNNEKLDTLYLKSGDLNFQLNTNLNHPAKIRITLPDVRKNGVPFSTTLLYNVGSNINTTLDLAGYKMVFHHTGGINNQLTVFYELTAYNTSGAQNQSPYTIDFSTNFENLKYSKMFGFLNYKEYLFPMDTLSIGIFKNAWFGNFVAMDPKVIIKITSHYGFPLHIIFDHLIATNPKSLNSLPVFGLPNPIAISSPLNPGDSSVTSVTLDKYNSNIVDAINILPHYFAYLFEGRANPTGVYTPNFALDTSTFNVDMEVEIPLYGSAWDFVLEDTVDFEFEKIDEVEYALFKISILNGFPVDANIQIYFADSLNNVLDSLFGGTKEVVLAALTGPSPEYRVTTPQTKYTEAYITANKLTNITNSRKMFIRSTLATTNNGSETIKIYSDYLIDVRLAVQAQLKVNLNE
ncbi:MAG: hypothetical protein PHT69_13720 [Bacteroidales bacterium]|nr:hypothetical protein [Bacteroidales bacterium]